MGRDIASQVALVALLAMTILFGGLGFYYRSQLGSELTPGSLADNVRIKLSEDLQLAQSIEDLAQQIAAEKQNVTDKRWQVELQKDILQRLRISRDNIVAQARLDGQRVASLERARRRIDDHYVQSTAADGGYGLRALSQRKETMEQEQQRAINALKSQLDSIQREMTLVRNRYARRFEDKRNERSELSTKLGQARSSLERASFREEIVVNFANDGEVIRSEIPSRLVVINIGERHGVKRGMRFEVFQMRGGRRIRKGFIDVMSTDSETSTCMIPNHQVLLPRDVVSSYVGKQPEELYSPYVTSEGLTHLKLVPDVEAVVGMDPNDPIVVGDLIYNPLFKPGRQQRFAVKGTELHSEYPVERMMSAITWHGGVIDPDVGAQTDVLLVGRYASEEARRAVELGIPVLHHFELFDFLRR